MCTNANVSVPARLPKEEVGAYDGALALAGVHGIRRHRFAQERNWQVQQTTLVQERNWQV